MVSLTSQLLWNYCVKLRTRKTIKFKQQKHKVKRKRLMKDEVVGRKEHVKDGISPLPDDILLYILSFLTLKEAACSSILARRWRYLWRYITGSLSFDSKTLRPPADGYSSSELETLKYVSWVNEVLKFHRGACINEMRISFNFFGNYPRDISDWIKFAVGKGVQRVELDVSLGFWAGMIKSYDFPSMENFKTNSSSNPAISWTSHGHHVSRTVGSPFCSLTTLRLVSVNIMEEVLENFLSNCPFLEQLCIVGSTCLVNLKIAGPSLKLKCLEISECPYLENLEISATNLVSFTYIGADISVPFREVPLLSELSIGGEFCLSFISGSCKHSSYIHQIQKLLLHLSPEELDSIDPDFQEICNVKQVELIIKGPAGYSLLSIGSVIRACPNLSKFSAQLFLYPLSKEGRRVTRMVNQLLSRCIDYSDEEDTDEEDTLPHHQCLKVVELQGFFGTNSEVDLVLDLIKIASSLEKLIIDANPIWYRNNNKKLKAAKGNARWLKTHLPATVELVILQSL